jgi:hypothetical protein
MTTKYKALTDKDIIRLLQKYNIKINSVIMSNENIKMYPGYYIVNLDKVGGCGTHWTCFYYTGKLNLYYDSFGKPPPLAIEEKLKPLLFYNKEQHQHPASEACGYYCIAWIRFIASGRNKPMLFNLFNNLLNDVQANETQLKFLL